MLAFLRVPFSKITLNFLIPSKRAILKMCLSIWKILLRFKDHIYSLGVFSGHIFSNAKVIPKSLANPLIRNILSSSYVIP